MWGTRAPKKKCDKNKLRMNNWTNLARGRETERAQKTRWKTNMSIPKFVTAKWSNDNNKKSSVEQIIARRRKKLIENKLSQVMSALSLFYVEKCFLHRSHWFKCVSFGFAFFPLSLFGNQTSCYLLYFSTRWRVKPWNCITEKCLRRIKWISK